MRPQIPNTPKSWFFVGHSKDFSNVQKLHKIMNKSFIIYRKKDGELVALGGRCPHMQADFQFGKVVNDQLVCHCHGWEFNHEGKCTRIPLAEDIPIPPFARVPKYPIVERNGLVFIFNGKKPEFELPFFNNQSPDDYICSKLQLVYQNTDWYIVTSNAYDLTHFIYLHQRVPVKPPQTFILSDYGRRIIVDYKVLGQNLLDKIIFKFFGGITQLDYSIWAGNFVLAETSIGGKFVNKMMILVEQTDTNSSITQLFVFGSKKNKNWFGIQILKFKLWIQSGLSRKFFEQEASTSGGMKLSYKTMNEKDVMVKDIVKWIENINSNNTETVDQVI